MKINGTIKIDVEVSPLDCINEMLLKLCNIKYIDDLGSIDIKNNSLCQTTDISYHGSPVWEDTIISSKVEDVKAFESLVYLKKYYKNKKI